MYSPGACCDKLQVHSKEKEAFSHSKYVGDFILKETAEGEPVVCNEAAVFGHTNGKLFLYRNKDGDWVVGKYLTEIQGVQKKLGLVFRSHFRPLNGGKSKKVRKQIPLKIQFYLLGGVLRSVYRW